MRSLALLVALLLAAGFPVPPPRPTLKTPSAEAARKLAEALLDAVQRRDLAAAATSLCGGDRARAASLGKVASYAIDHVEAAWVGAEPYFRVDVTLEKDGGSERRSFAVRARDGCVERTGGTPIGGAAAPEPGELSL